MGGYYAPNVTASPRPAHGSLVTTGPKSRTFPTELPSWGRWAGRDEARRAIRWVERYCRVSTGRGAGEPLRFAPFQKTIVRDLYANLAAFESIPVANGKTTLLGALALERVCRGDAYAEIDVLATKLDQAAEVVLAASRIAESSPEILERVALYEEGSVLVYRPTGSRLRALPARLRSLEGANYSLALIDEVGFAADDLIESLLARLGKRPDAHVLGIGTPGFEPNTLWRIRRDALEGELPPGVVYREWAAPEDAELDDPRAWRAANPAVAAGFLREEAIAMQAAALPESKFRVYVLGQWVDQAAAWLPAGVWEACPYAPAPAPGTEVVLAVEGTYRRTVALVGATLDGVVFHGWAAEAATDAELRAVLDEALERYDVLEVVHGRRIRAALFRDLEAEGVTVRPWTSNLDEEASSADGFYRAIVEGRVAHDHDELLAAHVSALRARLLSDGALRLTRPDDGRDADAGLAARAAWFRAGELAELELAAPVRIY